MKKSKETLFACILILLISWMHLSIGVDSGGETTEMITIHVDKMTGEDPLEFKFQKHGIFHVSTLKDMIQEQMKDSRIKSKYHQRIACGTEVLKEDDNVLEYANDDNTVVLTHVIVKPTMKATVHASGLDKKFQISKELLIYHFDDWDDMIQEIIPRLVPYPENVYFTSNIEIDIDYGTTREKRKKSLQELQEKSHCLAEWIEITNKVTFGITIYFVPVIEKYFYNPESDSLELMERVPSTLISTTDTDDLKLNNEVYLLKIQENTVECIEFRYEKIPGSANIFEIIIIYIYQPKKLQHGHLSIWNCINRSKHLFKDRT